MIANDAIYPVNTICHVLGVSTSGFYAWLHRGQSTAAAHDQALGARIRRIQGRSAGTYGAPRIHAQLVTSEGVSVGRKRVARLMQENGLSGVSRRKGPQTTTRSQRERPAPDLVDSDFSVAEPNRLWVGDITYVPSANGLIYLAVVVDAFSRRVVGWSMANPLVLNAFDMAVTQRRPDAVIFHSDQGCQYTSYAFGKRCREAGVRPSMGSVGDAYDNVLCESVFASLECELIDQRRFPSQAEARMAVFSYIEGWYNPSRRHSAIGYTSPIDYETEAVEPPAEVSNY